jgi:hypothetical protein
MFGPPLKGLSLREKWRFFASMFSIDKSRRVPRLVLHEKFEGWVKWTLRAFALIGVVVGGVSFHAWYYGVGIAILILAVQQLFERVLFEYTAIHVAPMPRRYEAGQWISMVFLYSPDPEAPIILGPAFKEREYAREILDVLRSWNYGKEEDPNDYIRLSFIMEAPEEYSVYLYPAPRRPSVGEFFDKFEAESREVKPGKRLMRLEVRMTFCKIFPRENSLLPAVHRRLQGKEPFLLTTFFKSEKGYEPLLDGAVLKFGYKFAERSALTSSDYESRHLKEWRRQKNAKPIKPA